MNLLAKINLIFVPKGLVSFKVLEMSSPDYFP